MPTYEYECPDCAHLFEVSQSFSDAPIKKCPACGKRKVQRLISGGGAVMFKGGGFYETDYNRGEGSDYKKKADAEKASSNKDAPAADKTKSGDKAAGSAATGSDKVPAADKSAASSGRNRAVKKESAAAAKPERKKS